MLQSSERTNNVLCLHQESSFKRQRVYVYSEVPGFGKHNILTSLLLFSSDLLKKFWVNKSNYILTAFFRIPSNLRKFWSSHNGGCEQYWFLGCGPVYWTYAPKLWRCLVVPTFSRQKEYSGKKGKQILTPLPLVPSHLGPSLPCNVDRFSNQEQICIPISTNTGTYLLHSHIASNTKIW